MTGRCLWSTSNLHSIALGRFIHCCAVCGSHGERGLPVGTSPRQCCCSYLRFCLDIYRLAGSYSTIPLPFPTLSRNLSPFLRSTARRVSIKVSCFRLISLIGSIRPEYLCGIPNIYEALSLGPNNSTKLFGSCPFTYKSWALAPAM